MWLRYANQSTTERRAQNGSWHILRDCHEVSKHVLRLSKGVNAADFLFVFRKLEHMMCVVKHESDHALSGNCPEHFFRELQVHTPHAGLMLHFSRANRGRKYHRGRLRSRNRCCQACCPRPAAICPARSPGWASRPSPRERALHCNCRRYP